VLSATTESSTRHSNGQTIAIYKILRGDVSAPDGLQAKATALCATAIRDAVVAASGTNGQALSMAANWKRAHRHQYGIQLDDLGPATYSAASQVSTAVNKMFDTLISAVR